MRRFLHAVLPTLLALLAVALTAPVLRGSSGFSTTLPGLSRAETNRMLDVSMKLSSEIYYSPGKGFFGGVWLESSGTLLYSEGRTLFVAFQWGAADPSSLEEVLSVAKDSRVQPFGDTEGFVLEDFYNRSGVNWGLQHNFFSNQYKVAPNSVADWVLRADYDRVVFTGHSSGGAVAQLTALRYLDTISAFPSLRKEFLVLTFGMPLVVSQSVVAWVGGDRQRFLNVFIRQDTVCNAYNHRFHTETEPFVPLGDYLMLNKHSRMQYDIRSDPKAILSDLDTAACTSCLPYHLPTEYLSLIEGIVGFP